jgi:hypothetical protein
MSENKPHTIAEAVSPSVALGLGSLAFVLSVLGGLILSGRKAWELDASWVALVVVLVLYTPVFLGRAMALGSVGAAFAEGVLQRRSVLGVALAVVGVTLEWILWQVGR